MVLLDERGEPLPHSICGSLSSSTYDTVAELDCHPAKRCEYPGPNSSCAGRPFLGSYQCAPNSRDYRVARLRLICSETIVGLDLLQRLLSRSNRLDITLIGVVDRERLPRFLVGRSFRSFDCILSPGSYC
jgi:hypothetical protein